MLNNIDGVVLVVLIMKVFYELDILVVSGLLIIIGVGEDKVFEKIVLIFKG